jgi:uncharacterized protein
MASIFKNDHGLRAGWRLIIYLVMVAALWLAASKLADFLMHGKQPDLGNPVPLCITMTVVFLVIFIPALVMARLEHRTMADYGLPARGALGTRFWIAAAVSLVSLALLLLALRIAQVYAPGPVTTRGLDAVRSGALWSLAALAGAMVEEFFHRGYVLTTLADGIGYWPAATVTSCIMGAMHIMNPGWTWLGLITIIGFCLLAALLRLRSGSLWMPIGLHTGWNWGEIFLFGIPCSGLMGRSHLLQGNFHGPAWITGMPFGVEAGAPNLLVFALWWWLILRFVRKPGGAPA